MGSIVPNPVERVVDVLHSLNCDPTSAGSGSFTSRCPNPTHGAGRGDESPSLSVSTGEDGRALLYCHARCNVEDVVAAWEATLRWLGLSSSDHEGHGDVSDA